MTCFLKYLSLLFELCNLLLKGQQHLVVGACNKLVGNYHRASLRCYKNECNQSLKYYICSHGKFSDSDTSFALTR